MRTRVTYFINSLEQGGAEGQLYALMAGIDRSRYECSLVVCTRKGASPDGLSLAHYHSLESPVFPLPTSVAALTRVLRAWRPDVVHACKGLENVVGRVAARRAGVPVVVGAVRRPRLPSLERWGEALTWRMTDGILVNSVGIRDELIRDAGVLPARVTVIENGVDLVRFRALSDSERSGERAARGLEGAFTVVMPARISGEKNQLAVVRALGRLAREGALPRGFRLVMAGRDSLPVYGRAVRLAAQVEGVADRVAMPGAIPALEGLLGACDGVLLPSRFEGLPNAVVEALACGVPSIVSREANVDGLVTDGVEGLVATSYDVRGIAAALRRYFALDEGARRAMGRRGRAMAERRFAMARMVEETAAVYERLLANRHRTGA